MNKDEVIKRIRDHLRGRGYKITEPEVFITKTDFRLCVTLIMDFLVISKAEAEQIMNEDVLAGTNLCKERPVNTSKELYANCISPAELAKKTSIPKHTIMSAIYAGRIIAVQKSNRWLISESEAEKFTANYKGRRGKKKDENNNK